MRVVDAPAMRRAERNLLWFFYCSLYTVYNRRGHSNSGSLYYLIGPYRAYLHT